MIDTPGPSNAGVITDDKDVIPADASNVNSNTLHGNRLEEALISIAAPYDENNALIVPVSSMFSKMSHYISNLPPSKSTQHDTMETLCTSPSPRRVGVQSWCMLAVYKMVPLTGVFRRLKARLDTHTVRVLDKILSLRIRMTKLVTKIRWYDQCIEKEIFPMKVLDRLKRPSVSAAIRILKDDVVRLQHQKEGCQHEMLLLSTVTSTLSFYAYCMFFKYCLYITRKVKNDIIAKLTYNTLNLTHIANLEEKSNNITNITNLSNYNLSDIERYALSFGTKFCVPPRKINTIKDRSEFESLYNQLNSLSAKGPLSGGLLPARLANLAHEFSQISHSRCTSPLNSAHLTALQRLSKNNNLIITNSDKGGGVVILNTDDYVDKVQAILNDSTKFSVDTVQKNTCTNLLTELKSLLNTAVQNNLISDHLRNILVPKGCIVPRLYGLPKTHKSGYPVRPILSMVGTATHKTAKFLARVLKPVEEHLSYRCTQDSYTLVDSLSKFNDRGIPTDSYTLASLDIVSLYTNVPVKECFDVINSCINSSVSVN